MSPMASLACAFPGQLLSGSPVSVHLSLLQECRYSHAGWGIGTPGDTGWRAGQTPEHQPKLPCSSLAGYKCFYSSLLFPETYLMRHDQEAP